MSAQVTLNKQTLSALEDLQKHDDGFPEFIEDMENYLINDDHLYEDTERCVDMVLLLKTFRYYAGIVTRLMEKGGCDEV